MSDDLARRAAEQILTDSSLTDDLDDTEAKRLLDWALVLIKEMTRNVPANYEFDEEEGFEAHMYSLRRTVRGINSLAGTLPDLEEDRIVKKLERLFERAGGVPNLTVNAPADVLVAAQSLKGQPADAALNFIMGHFTLPGEAEPDVLAGMADGEQASSGDDQTPTTDVSGGPKNDPWGF